jgi:hypothetical protein
MRAIVKNFKICARSPNVLPTSELYDIGTIDIRANIMKRARRHDGFVDQHS